MKLFVIGHGRHGKTEAGEFLSRSCGLKYCDSSEYMSERVVRPYLSDRGIEYANAEACYEDRHNHRSKWYDAISEFNGDDPTSLSRAIFAENDIYVGIRSRREFLASKHLADLSIWVDASERCDPEPEGSMTILKCDADMVIYNNDGLGDFHQKLVRLAKCLRG